MSLLLGGPILFDGRDLFGQTLRHVFLDDEPSLLTVPDLPQTTWHPLKRQHRVQKVKKEDFAFRVNLDVHHFQPEEISVKTVDNAVTVEGKHEDRQDEHGYIQRHFLRRYVLPEDAHAEHVQCNLSLDGILKISVPKKGAENAEMERIIPITCTNAPAVKHHAGPTQISM